MTFSSMIYTLFCGLHGLACGTSVDSPLAFPRCWSWPLSGDERLCGGRYRCEDSPGGPGYCGGHPQDANEAFRPLFAGGQRGFPWCAGSEPVKAAASL